VRTASLPQNVPCCLKDLAAQPSDHAASAICAVGQHRLSIPVNLSSYAGQLLRRCRRDGCRRGRALRPPPHEVSLSVSHELRRFCIRDYGRQLAWALQRPQDRRTLPPYPSWKQLLDRRGGGGAVGRYNKLGEEKTHCRSLKVLSFLPGSYSLFYAHELTCDVVERSAQSTRISSRWSTSVL
jgi:hypothetical protein